MGTIRLLSDQLINKIAAGEVVERPASVLKELVENSLDAGADRIEIDTEDGGRRLIMVADNGKGLDRDDLFLAVERHATSKLGEETDLLHIGTLGFRGEALPSIASVSRFSILSAPGDDGRGGRIRMSGGRMMGYEEAARDRGATIEVRDLFFNTPARRKFLKAVQTEAAHLLETAQRYALGHPGLRLIYRHNGQEQLSTSPMEDVRSRLAKVLGRDTAREMIPFEGGDGPLALSGFLGPPDRERSRAGELYLYVNGRPVKDRLVTRAVMDAYRGRISAGRYPAAVVFLTIDPDQVDVNVHPTKAEVRFRQPGSVIRTIAGVLGEALSESFRSGGSMPLPDRSNPPYRPTEPYTPHQLTGAAPVGVREAVSDLRRTPEFNWPEISPSRMMDRPLREDRSIDAPNYPESMAEAGTVRAVGQLYQSYILAQGPDGLVIVDQHAAHERILFEQLQNRLASGSLPGQALLIPETIDLSPTQAAAVESVLGDFARIGFELAHFGGPTWVIKSAPAVLRGKHVVQTLLDIIAGRGSSSTEAGSDGQDRGLSRFEETVLSSLACHVSVKANEGLTVPEMNRLLSDLNGCRTPTHCPHGRPLILTIDRRDIEKKFKR